MVKYSPRRAHRRANLPITGGMGHEQMVREAHISRRSPPDLSKFPSRCPPHLAHISRASRQVREAKLRAAHNRQRAQLKGYIRGAAGGGDYVDHQDLALAAQLAKMAVPAAIYSPRKADPWRKGHAVRHHAP